MKLPSLRTWLIVVASVLVLAGVGVVYIIKNPSLPRGWVWHEEVKCRVALPPGERWPVDSEPKVRVIVGEKAFVSLTKDDGDPARGLSPEESLDAHFDSIVRRDDPLVKVRERFKTRDGQAIVYRSERSVNVGIKPMEWIQCKGMVIRAKGRFYHLSADLVPGVLTEEDADFLSRSFRPK